MVAISLFFYICVNSLFLLLEPLLNLKGLFTRGVKGQSIITKTWITKAMLRSYWIALRTGSKTIPDRASVPKNGDFCAISVKVDFHGRVIFTQYARKFYARKWKRDIVLKVTRNRKKLNSAQFYVYAWPFIHCLFFIYARKRYVFARKKTRQYLSPISKVKRHIVDEFCASLWCGVNRYLDRSGSE